MRCSAAFVAAVLGSSPVSPQAEEPAWEPLAGADRAVTVEIDRGSLDRREGLLTVWLRLDFAEPARGRIQAFRSAVAQHAVDCRQRRHAAIRMTTYSGHLGQGDVVDRWDSSPEHWDWRSARGDPADEGILRVACDQAPATVLSRAITTSPAYVPST